MCVCASSVVRCQKVHTDASNRMAKALGGVSKQNRTAVVVTFVDTKIGRVQVWFHAFASVGCQLTAANPLI